MARPLSATALAAVFAQETEEVFVVLLEIDQGALGSPIRLARNGQDVTHLGNIYTGLPFDITLPMEREDELPTVTLQIDNVDQNIVQWIRSMTGPPTITLTVVLASTPDVIEAGPWAMELKDASYDALVVQGTVGFENVLDQPYPGHAFVPKDFPGLF